jgi:HdeA/HdeB family protein
LVAAQAALACCVESAVTDENKSMNTNRYLVKLALAATTLAGAFQLTTALAQDSQTRTIEQYTCKDIMREAGADRDIAIAFLHGFLLGKSGTPSFNLDVLHKQTTEFIERCLNSPADKAVDVMSKLKSEWK